MAKFFAALLPSATFWPLPTGLTDALEWIATPFAYAGAFLPDGMLSTAFAALSLLLAVNLFVLPWLWARGFRLPFAAWNKG